MALSNKLSPRQEQPKSENELITTDLTVLTDAVKAITAGLKERLRNSGQDIHHTSLLAKANNN